MESKFQYYKRVVKGASFNKFFSVVEEAHKRSGKNRVYLFFDILKCMKKYSAGYNDYVIFEFWQSDAGTEGHIYDEVQEQEVHNVHERS